MNVCSLDLSKAFDKVNHHALFIKLMNRSIPINLLRLLESWYSNCQTCIKWNFVISRFFNIRFGVRQGSVLSPTLFAVYINDIVSRLPFSVNSFIVLYADDILLMAPSVTELQRMLTLCETELTWLDMTINVKKSSCIRIGPRYSARCVCLKTASGITLPWVFEVRYLGTIIISSRLFKCSLSHAKRAFYCAANSIFGKIGRLASEEVILQLIQSKCIPVLIYGLEVFAINSSDLKSLDFTVNRFFMKLFRTSNINIITDCQLMFNFVLPSAQIAIRTHKFLANLSCVDLS